MTPEGTTTGSTSDGTSCEPGELGCECKEDNSCDVGLICASNECIPGGDPSTSTGTDETTTSSDATTEPGTSSGTTTGTSATTEQPACEPSGGVVDNPDCETGLYCNESGECVDCGGLTGAESCASIDANTPVCDDGSGTCVECREGDLGACGGETPICDVETMSCVPCTSHGDCQSGACVLATGACFPTDGIIWVNRLGANCLEATGTNDKPFCEIADAVDSINGNDPRLIRVKPSANYTKQIDIPSGLTVAIMRESGESNPITLRVTNVDSIQVSQNAKVYIEDLEVYGEGPTTAAGVVCNSAVVSLGRSAIVDKKGVGVISNDCELTVTRAWLFNNSGGGVQASSGTVRVANTIIGGNGSGFATLGGFRFDADADVEILYSTIAYNSTFAADAIDCDGDVDVTGTVRNSIVFGSGDQNSVTCSDLTFTTSAVDTDGLMGQNNKLISPAQVQPSWFVDVFVGDFHLTGGGDEFEGVAVWNEGDPAVDYDGEPRPTVDSSSDHAGADVP